MHTPSSAPSRIRQLRHQLFGFLLGLGTLAPLSAATPEPIKEALQPVTPARLFPLGEVRLLDQGPFAPAIKANRQYLLALDPDRLLAPFRREAGLPAKAKSYDNWESGGLDGHTAGHYLSALAHMIAAKQDSSDGLLNSRLAYMLNELQACQEAFGDGYLGGVPGSRELWRAVAAGDLRALEKKWVPWYNLHKTFAGLRDACLETGNQQARKLLVNLGNWSVELCGHLSDTQMQQMLATEHGGMNESLADLYALTGDTRYLAAARRFNHKAVLDPLVARQDKLTGLHANTQIPKVIGLERIALLTSDAEAAGGARFFWDNVTSQRTVAFGGNSVSEHFNDPHDFSGMLMHREGPETCNTYNMLRLTEQLFTGQPMAAFADYYENALYNHLLASINPERPGYVYFTPIRPGHYRVYSQPEHTFWCCVGTGMENPGKYGEFIYARDAEGLFVNLFIASELTVPELGLVLRQETKFPDEERSRFVLTLNKPTTFTLKLRHPAWVPTGAYTLRINGESQTLTSAPSSYASLRREWKNGDTLEVMLPMRTRIEGLPDGSGWVAIKHGPILLASPTGTQELAGLYADGSRMGHVANGPVVPLDQVPVLLTTVEELPKHVVPTTGQGPLSFRLTDVEEPSIAAGLPLEPFFRLHNQRYQMYWQLTTKEGLEERRQRLAAAERANAVRESATLDRIAVGEQQPEVEHELAGEGMETGLHNGRHWRHGKWIQYTLDPRGAQEAELSVLYSGSDRGRNFDILVNGQVIATQKLTAEKPFHFIEKRYPLPSGLLKQAGGARLTVRFQATGDLAGGLYEVRLLRPGTPLLPPAN